MMGTRVEVPSLFDVNFQIYSGEGVGIVGPAGSGKSTLLQHLNGLIRPQIGEVVVNGVPLSQKRIDIRKIRQMIGLVFQNPEDQLFERYAGDDVAFGPRNFGLPQGEVRKRVRNAMEMVGLPFSFKDRLTMDLSQGERRRLALAGIFALEPRVLLLDEPTAGLDPEGRVELLGMLKEWRKKEGRAVVIVSHNVEDIIELTERVYFMTKGRVKIEGKTRDVFTEYEFLHRHGYYVPVPVKILLYLAREGIAVSRNRVTISEVAAEIGSIINGSKIGV
jgi:energy-coupling factor transport system ATP-binding protein